MGYLRRGRWIRVERFVSGRGERVCVKLIVRQYPQYPQCHCVLVRLEGGKDIPSFQPYYYFSSFQGFRTFSFQCSHSKLG
jgi:hypothetical protein